MKSIATARQPLNKRQREPGVAEVRRRLREQPAHPPSRGTLKSRIFSPRQDDQNRKRILETHLRQLDGRSLYELQIARGERAESGCRQSLATSRTDVRMPTPLRTGCPV
jgi:hypothetical protein